MAEKDFEHVFGPVPSRRLGRSLGVDLVPFKTCSYDCIYCQLGKTTKKTIERKGYAPIAEVLDEVGRKLEETARPDFITLSGSGEPTLHARLHELIAGIKEMTGIPLAVLTNGSLLWDAAVRDALLEVDLVIPSLDAGTPRAFARINRPHHGISFEKMLGGLVDFRARTANRMWLEVFLVAGITGTGEEVEAIKGHIEKIDPDRIQLNTVIRPPAQAGARAVPEAEMRRFAAMLGDKAEVIADFEKIHREGDFKASREEVLGLLERRPCSLEDVAQGLMVHPNEALKHLGELMREGAVTTETRRGRVYYLARGKEGE